ncbi:hypothetical protein ACROYT_G032880 [Oculina patagonica]
MLHRRQLTTLLVIVVLLNPCRIDSKRSRGTRDSDIDVDLMEGMSRQTAQQIEGTKLKNVVAAAFEHAQHHHLHERQLQEKPVIHHAEDPGQENKKHDESSIEDEGNPEKDGEIHVEVSDRHVRDDEEEKDGYSGDGSHIDVRDLHYHIHKSDHQGEKKLKERKETDPEDEDGYVEFSGEDSDIEELHVHGKETRDFNSRSPIDDEDAKTPWEHFKMHLHSHGEKNGEFGYITDEEEDPEENDDESLSGERDYDHEHIKTLHVHHRAKHVKYPRDSDVVVGRTEQEIAGEDEDEDEEYEDEQSGEEGLNSIYERRDLHKSEGENEWEENEGSLISEDEEDETDLSGREDLSVRDQENNEEDNGRDSDSKTEKASKDDKGKGKEKISGKKKEGPGSQKKIARKKNKLGNKNKFPKKNVIREKIQKFSSGKKKSSSVGNQESHQSQKLKVHAEVDLSHQKKTDVSTKDTTAKKKKARPLSHKAPNDQKIRDVEPQTGSENGLKNVEDFYIDESDEPKQRMFAVEMRDAVEGKDHGENINPGNRKIDKRSQSEDGKAEKIQEFRRGNSRHLLQFINTSDPLEPLPSGPTTHCTHPALAEKITDQTIVYIRAECRVCQCKIGELICDAKPELCDQQLARPCPMAKGELADGARHFDGCNNCVCRNGELLCTRVRCPSSNYNYTNYRTGAVGNSTLENALMSILNEGVVRGKDWCMECDSEPVSPVCGPNWKTYQSMCHAFQCGGFGVEDVKQGKCESLHPCTGVKCAEHEICIVDRRGPCLAATTRNGDIIECSQHQCVSPKETLNCSSAHVEQMCGEDHNNYMSKCEMFGKGVALAYYGSCKEECLTYDTRMCGVDGVTLQSICHASLHNSHVDYPGQCDEVDPKNNHFMENSALVGHFNPRCKTVAELARCPDVNCVNPVIPEGSCCPICGTAVSIRLDTAARDMICLNDKIQPPQDLSRSDVIFSELKNLSNQFGGLEKCQLTVDLVDTHDVSVVYKPITFQDKDACEQVVAKTVAFINSPAKSDLEPAKALLAAAVIKERGQRIGLPRAMSIITKRRMKRDQHHEHEPYYNKSDRIRLQNHLIFLAVITFVLVYKPNRILN